MLIDEPRAFAIVQTLQGGGFTAYYAGGCVRDALLGRAYNDIDIATDATPEDVMRFCPRTVAVGAHFGVIKVLSGDSEFDVATFRSDGEYLDGRHPDTVSYSSPREDALRRDITINGMFYDPQADEVIDYVEGRDDLEKGIIRCIGDPSARIREDGLRLLRIIRFAGIFGFAIEQVTRDSIVALRSGISNVSAERIQEELSKMAGSPVPADCIELLLETGLMEIILPEIAAMDGIEQPPQFHPEGDVLEHTLLMLRMFQDGIKAGEWEPSLIVTLAILLHDVGKPPTFYRAEDRIRFNGHCVKGARMAKSVLERLKYPNKVVDEVEALVGGHMRFMEVTRMRESTLKRFLRQDYFDRHMLLHWLDCQASHGDMTCFNFCTAKQEEFGPVEELKPPPLLNGNDLIALGYKPGPDFKTMLDFIEDLQLEGTLQSREGALEAVQSHFKRFEAGKTEEST